MATKGIVVKIGDMWYLRTSASRKNFVPYTDTSGNTINWEDGPNQQEWMDRYGNYLSSDSLIQMTSDQKTIDVIENARNLSLPDTGPLTWWQKLWLNIKVGIFGFADNTYNIPWWVYAILIIGFILFVFKPFKRRRSR